MVTSDFLPKSFFEGKIHFSFFLQYLWRNTWNKNRGRHGGYLFFPLQKCTCCQNACERVIFHIFLKTCCTPAQTIELSFSFCYQFLNLEFQHAPIPWRLIQAPTSTAQILLPCACAAPASGTREGNLDPMRCDSCLPIACTARQPGRQHAPLAASIQIMGKDAQLDMFVGTSA